jgi:hypothetical protein
VRKFLLLATMLAMMVAIMAISAVPAMAQPRIVAPNAFRNADITANCSNVGFANSNPNLCRNAFSNNFNDNFDNNPFNNRFFRDRDNFDGNNGLDISQRTDETGDVNLNSEIVNTGNNSNQCAAPLQFGNTGNLQNAQGFVQGGGGSNGGSNFPNRDFFNPFRDNLRDNFDRDNFDRDNFDNFGFNPFFNGNDGRFDNGLNSLDDVEFEAPEMTFNPRQNVDCNQAVEQAASASGN